ncbi:MAG: anti-sigma factor domain-containing protein [Eubacteriales bacterium]|nr:anti-sigma factor domain-containing protein [Eubacteriales bacterium]
MKAAVKAVVMETKKDKAIVLDSTGRYHRIANDGSLRVGCEINMDSVRLQKTMKPMKAASIAAAFLIVAGGVGAYSYSQPYSYVEVDINPSVMFTANIFDRIIKAEAFNEDGTDIIGQDSYSNMTLKKGLDHLLEKAVEKGYIKEENDNAVLVTVTSKNVKKADAITYEANDVVTEELKKSSMKSEVAVETVNIKERKQQSQQSIISPGKTALIEKLAETNPELDIEELKEAPVKDLVKSINEIRKQEKEEQKQQKEQEKAQEKEQKDREREEKMRQNENEKKNKNSNKNGRNGNSRGNRN